MKNTVKKDENAKTFFTTDLLTAYEKAVKNAHDHNPTIDYIRNDPTVIDTLQAVAQWTTFAVLKKLRNVGGEVKQGDPTPHYNAIPHELTRGLVADIHNADRRRYMVENDYTIEYNDDGDKVIKYNDLHKDTHKVIAENYTDSIDLLQTALLTIWAETVRIITDDPTALDSHFMTAPTPVRRLRRKVYIKDDPTAPSMWETVDATPVQTAFKSVRRDIKNSRHAQINNKYVYIDDLTADPDDPDHTEKVYRRLDRLTANLTAVNMTTDLDGRPTLTNTTADPTAVADTTELLTALNLTTRQATILQYVTQGYGYKAIATRLQIRPDSVRDCVKAIRKKAVTVFADRPDLCDPSILAKYTK